MEGLKEMEQIIKMAENYAAKHQIIFCDYHRKMIVMVIGEALKMGGRIMLEPLKTTINYDMDIYGDQVPYKSK